MDFYGADRVGDDLFADCLLALNAQTGERVWHFQEVRHDIWDRDLPAPPLLLTVKHEGKDVEAVAQTTKQGFVYLFDRSNGQPLFPVEYRKFPSSTVPGEVAAAEQPVPTRPPPYARLRLSEDGLTTRTAQAHEWALEQFHKFRSEGQFVPFSVGKDTVIFPGFDGGAEWGGPAVDRETAILYVNANDVAWTGALAEEHGREHRQGDLSQPVRSLPRREDDGLSTCDTFVGWSGGSSAATATGCDHQERERKDAWFSQPDG